MRICVPANGLGSHRALGGEVWGGEGLDDGQSVLRRDTRGKEYEGKRQRQRDNEGQATQW